MSHAHIEINQVDNGWVISIVMHNPADPTKNDARVLIANNLRDACTMVQAEVGEDDRSSVSSFGRA